MFDKILRDTSKRNFIFVALLLFLIIFLFEKINGRFWLNDFKVFYLAAKALLNNEQVYGISFGLETGFYKYSPFTLFFFVPLTFFSFDVARVMDFIINSSCTVAEIIILYQIISKHVIQLKEIKFKFYLFALLCIVNHLVRELHLGNTNMILLFLLTLALNGILERKYLLPGALLAIVVLTKPYFLICFLPLIAFKKYKAVMAFLISLVLFISFTILVTGGNAGLTLLSEWLQSMKEHSNYLNSNHTIPSILGKYFGISISPSLNIFILGIMSIVATAYFYFIDKRKFKNQTDDKSFVILYFVLIAMVPSILITDTEHFLFSLPLIVFMILSLSENKNIVAISLFVLLMILYGGNSSDFLGKKLSGVFEDYGVLGISNVVLIVWVIVLFTNRSLSNKGVSNSNLNFNGNRKLD